MTAAFLDSNILIYAYSVDPRREHAYQLMRENYVIGVQTLNEFAYVAHRKLKMNWQDIAGYSLEVADNAEAVVPSQLADHRQSLALAQRYRLSIFDALMLAIALRAGSSIFYSEDMHHGLVIDSRLTIANPFI